MKTTTMGTRVILRPGGSYIQLEKTDDGLVLLTVHDGETRTVCLGLSQRECITLIEYLAVAATPNSEKEVIEVIDDEATNTKATVELLADTQLGCNCRTHEGHDLGVPCPIHCRTCGRERVRCAGSCDCEDQRKGPT